MAGLGGKMENEPKKRMMRKDVVALWAGIAFALGFTLLIWWAGRFLNHDNFYPDSGASWYYWRLPNPTFWSHATAWGLYLLHQFSIWGVIFYAQTRIKRYSLGLQKINILALGINALFIGLHFIQTHIWYDGLAQDVSIWSSLASVVIMLVWILLMETKRRGLFLGKQVPISQQIVSFARKYHGYFFAWATIYTFWYHPMENTPGHLAGFLYMFLLLLQGSLMYTRIHLNKYWTFTLEVGVLVHGTLVALFQGANLWPMFFFGFAGIIVLTQMHGLGLPRWAKWSLFGAYLVAAVWVYSFRGVGKIYELISIPLIEYAGVVVLALLIGAGLWIQRKTRKVKIAA